MRPEALSKPDRRGHRSGARARGRARVSVVKSKKDVAVQFIQEIQRMDAPELHALINREAGEDLAQFFMSYAATLIAKDPQRVLQNGSSLMLMGYLIRTQEERRKGVVFEQPLAYA